MDNEHLSYEIVILDHWIYCDLFYHSFDLSVSRGYERATGSERQDPLHHDYSLTFRLQEASW